MGKINRDSFHIPKDAQGRIAAPIPCKRCSTLLRGISFQDNCPECGFPVEKSTHSHLLHLSSPRWLLKLNLGSVFLLLSNALLLVRLFLVFFDPSQTASSVLCTAPAGGNENFICLLFIIISGVGMFLVTSPPRGISGKDTDLPVRGSAAILSGLWVTVALISLVHEEMISFGGALRNIAYTWVLAPPGYALVMIMLLKYADRLFRNAMVYVHRGVSLILRITMIFWLAAGYFSIPGYTLNPDSEASYYFILPALISAVLSMYVFFCLSLTCYKARSLARKIQTPDAFGIV